MSKQHSTLLPQTATVSNDSVVKFRPFDNVECCLDIVAGVDGASTKLPVASTMLLRHCCYCGRGLSRQAAKQSRDMTT